MPVGEVPHDTGSNPHASPLTSPTYDQRFTIYDSRPHLECIPICVL